jgi:DNA-binding Lrp family transcriptional regulator
VPLNDIDRQLIARLSDNARLSLVALAKTVGLSRSAVQERLARLERSGVIAGYGVRLGTAGQPRLQAWLLIRHSEGFSCADVMPELIALPGVTLCHSVAGDTDLMVLTATDTASELARLREHIAALKSVDDVTTIPVLEVTLDRR